MRFGLLIIIIFFFFAKPAFAYSLNITAINIQSTQAQLAGGCDDGVQCDPGSIESYVLDINTLEQRKILIWSDDGYNLSTITWLLPLISGHTYKIIMHSDLFGGESVSQEFLYVESTPTDTPTPTLTPTPTNTIIPTSVPTSTPTPTIIAIPTPTPMLRTLKALYPAKIWIGLSNIFDIGILFDLKAEIYKNNIFISSGQVSSARPGFGIGGFLSARVDTIPFSLFAPVDFSTGSNLKLILSVRNACFGSLRNSGVARIWFNDNQADSHFGATIGTNTRDYFLRNNFVLASTKGIGPKKTIDVQVGGKCGAFKPFGTWVVNL